jgi:carbon-monoxide dehydrogenase medium subunit
MPAAELFVDYLTTSLQPDEVITEVRIPSLDGWGFGYQKFNRRAEDWAMVAVPVLVKARDGVCEDVRIGLTNMAGRRCARRRRGGAARAGRSTRSRSRGRRAAPEGTDPPATSTRRPTTSATSRAS